MKKYVLTGGPSIGKSTVINILASRGYAVVPEAADIIIREERVKPDGILLNGDVHAFQLVVAEKQMELEQGAKGELVFLDRSIVDGYAYCKHAGVEIPELITDNGKSRYDAVFLLEPLGIYEHDGIRSLNLEEALAVHDLIKEAYELFGYNLISVPVLPPEERADFILRSLGLI